MRNKEKKSSYKKNDGKRNKAVAPSFSVILLYAILAYYYKSIPRRPKVPCRCFLSTGFQHTSYNYNLFY